MPIYEPRGRARDDSENAFNIYTSCGHKCRYCYAPAVFMKKRQWWFDQPAVPRKILDEELNKNVPKHANQKAQVLFCFTCDPYGPCEPEFRATRKCLEVFLQHRIPVAILSKGGHRVLADIDIFKAFGEHIKVGQTLTCSEKADSFLWESGAALPDERIDTARQLKEAGIRTFASIEPVIIPSQSLAMIEKTMPYIDEYRIGKLNNFRGMDKQVNWQAFLIEAVSLCRKNNKRIFVKKDLADFNPSYLTEVEKNPDAHQATPFN